jgi:hypothetical protein
MFQAWKLVSGRAGRLWTGLSAGKRTVGFGAALIVIMAAARLLPSIWRGLIDAASLGAFYGTGLVWGLPKISNLRDPGTRVAARAAAVIAAAGVALSTAGVLLKFFSVTGWGDRAAVGGAALLLASVAAFAIVSQITWAVRLFGRAAVVTGSLLLLAAILLFPPVIVFLMTNGQWPSPLLGGPQEPVWADWVAVIPPAALLAGPMILREIRPWQDAEQRTRELASAWLAGIALVFTCGYALALHYVAANPLTVTPISGLTAAILFVGVFLWPLYKQLAASFWRLGLVDAFKFTSWRQDQRAMGKELRDAVRRGWHDARATEDKRTSGNRQSPEPVSKEADVRSVVSTPRLLD